MSGGGKSEPPQAPVSKSRADRPTLRSRRDASGALEPFPAPASTARLPRLRDADIEPDFDTRTSQTAIKVSPAGAPLSAVLTVLTGLSAGQVFSLDRGDLIVGRSQGCQLRLDDPGISRRHCRFRKAKEGAFLVEDLRSTNGTYVDGKAIEVARVGPGARIQVGADVVLRFSLTDETEEALAKRLYESSTRDPLTHVFTRKYFDERLEAEIAYAVRHKSPLGVIMFDLDAFKAINDTYGHAAGDTVLRSVAGRVDNLIRAEDVLARYGGEEFVILARGIKRKQMVQFADRIRKSVAQLETQVTAHKLVVTISVGVAMLEEVKGKRAAKEMLALADERVYRSKTLGRNCTTSA